MVKRKPTPFLVLIQLILHIIHESSLVYQGLLIHARVFLKKYISIRRLIIEEIEDPSCWALIVPWEF